MARSTLDRIAAADPQAPVVYSIESSVAAAERLRRYATFAELVAHVERIVCSTWWEHTFPDAPIEVHVQRRSRTATFSAASRDDAEQVANLWIVDSHGWNLSVVLHELAHVAVPVGSAHGPLWRDALLKLWRQEAGFVAYMALRTALAERFDDVDAHHTP